MNTTTSGSRSRLANDPSGTQVATEGTPAVTPPAAVIYVPAINETADTSALEGVARRIARTLDYQERPVNVTFSVRPAAPEKYGQVESVAQVYEILRAAPEQTPVVTHRVYGVAYHPALEQAHSGNMAIEAFRVVILWLHMMVLFIRPLVRATAIAGRQKIAVISGGCALALLTLYVALIVTEIAKASLPETGWTPTQLFDFGSFADYLRRDWPRLTEALATIATPFAAIISALAEVGRFLGAAWFAVMGGIGPLLANILLVAGTLGITDSKVRHALENAVQIFLRFGRYLTSGAGRSNCIGQFNALLEHVLGRAPSRVDVVSYSMGSLVALDALFPSNPPANDRVAYVTTLTTIGCPFDLVRTFWPNYFTDRTVPPGDITWINVYSPVDLLGSNFTNDRGVKERATHGLNHTTPWGERPATKPKDRAADPQPPEARVPAANLYFDHLGRRDLDLPGAIFGAAYAAHSQYWVPDDYEAESCFTVLVPRIYSTPPVPSEADRGAEVRVAHQ